MAGERNAAVKGSIGCLIAFVVLALLAVLVGGQAYMDFGGFILLLVIGAVIGLVVNWIYQRGKRDGDP